MFCDQIEYFILLNSDVEVGNNWISPIIDYMDENNDVAACQPKVLSFKNKDLFEHAGASGGFIDKFGYPFCRGRIFDVVEKDSGQYDLPIDIFWATGAALFIRSECFFSVSGFDENFFAHMEEIDLCWRLKINNKRLVCIPQSVVYHVGGATLDAANPQKVFLNFRNNLLMIYKNESSERIKKVLLCRFILDYIAAFVFLIKKGQKNSKLR